MLTGLCIGIIGLQGCSEKTKVAEDSDVQGAKDKQTVIVTSSENGKTNPNLESEKATEELSMIKTLIYSRDYENISKRLEVITENNSLSQGEALELASIYQDANAMMQIYEMKSAEAAVERMMNFEHPDVTAFAPIGVFNVLVAGFALDVDSLDISGDYNVSNVNRIFIEPSNKKMVDIPQLEKFAATGNIDINGVYQYDFMIAGVEVTSYVINYKDQTNELIGYYSVDPRAELEFQTIRFFQDQFSELSDAVQTNWGEGWEN